MGRPLWKGTISFGLVSIPVQLEASSREKSVSFHLLSKDGSCRLRRKLYCPETGEEFDYDQTSRGIEVAEHEYVRVDDKEIDAVKPAKSKAIEIEQFVKLADIDPIYFDRTYYVTPGDGSGKAYSLLRDAMSASGRIALARFVMRERQYLAALRVVDEGIVLHTLHYADEVLSLHDAMPPSVRSSKSNAKELTIAKQLVDAMTKPLDLGEFHDDYREHLLQLIERKKKGNKTIEVSDEQEDDESPGGTINLMAALKRSLSGARPARPRSPRARHPRKRVAV